MPNGIEIPDGGHVYAMWTYNGLEGPCILHRIGNTVFVEQDRVYGSRIEAQGKHRIKYLYTWEISYIDSHLSAYKIRVNEQTPETTVSLTYKSGPEGCVINAVIITLNGEVHICNVTDMRELESKIIEINQHQND